MVLREKKKLDCIKRIMKRRKKKKRIERRRRVKSEERGILNVDGLLPQKSQLLKTHVTVTLQDMRLRQHNSFIIMFIAALFRCCSYNGLLRF